MRGNGEALHLVGASVVPGRRGVATVLMLLELFQFEDIRAAFMSERVLRLLSHAYAARKPATVCAAWANALPCRRALLDDAVLDEPREQPLPFKTELRVLPIRSAVSPCRVLGLGCRSADGTHRRHMLVLEDVSDSPRR